jgi:hypothetical protein
MREAGRGGGGGGGVLPPPPYPPPTGGTHGRTTDDPVQHGEGAMRRPRCPSGEDVEQRGQEHKYYIRPESLRA